MLINVSKTQI